MSPDVLLECPRTSFRDVLRVNVTERVWHSPSKKGRLCCVPSIKAAPALCLKKGLLLLVVVVVEEAVEWRVQPVCQL